MIQIDVVEGNLITDCILVWDVVKEVDCIVIERPRDIREWRDENSNYFLLTKVINVEFLEPFLWANVEFKKTTHKKRATANGQISKFKFIRPHFTVGKFTQSTNAKGDEYKYVTPLVCMSNLWLSNERPTWIEGDKASPMRHEMTYKSIRKYWQTINDIERDVYEVGKPYTMVMPYDSLRPEFQQQKLEEVFADTNVHIILFKDDNDTGHTKDLFPTKGKKKAIIRKRQPSLEVYEKNHWHNDRWANHSRLVMKRKQYEVRKGLRRKGGSRQSPEEIERRKKLWREKNCHTYLQKLEEFIEANNRNSIKGREKANEKIQEKIDAWEIWLSDNGHDVVNHKSKCKLCNGESNDTEE